MTLFVEFNSKQRELFFSKIKQKIKSWETFYPEYKISRSMFFNYLSGKHSLPAGLFDAWKKLIDFKENVEKIEKKKFLQKELADISLDENLSEILGVLNGDGHLSKNKKEICITGNRNEENYALYLQSLFSKKLKIDFNLFFYGNCFKLKGYSTKLSNFLINKYGVPYGNKLGKLHIPKRLLTKKKYTLRYIKGLFDTDGTIYFRRQTDAVIEISNADKNYLIEVKNVLENFGFSISLLKNHIAIYKKEDIKKFFLLFKPSNNKHLKKFENYSKVTASII